VSIKYTKKIVVVFLLLLNYEWLRVIEAWKFLIRVMLCRAVKLELVRFLLEG